jgi:hypothetical protein
VPNDGDPKTTTGAGHVMTQDPIAISGR